MAAAKPKKQARGWAALAESITQGAGWGGLKQLPVATLGTQCESPLSYGSVPSGERTGEWLWDQAIHNKALGYAVLEHPEGAFKFRLVCQPGWGRAIVSVHPDEAGLLVRAVAPYMRNVPTFAQRATQIYLSEGTAPAGVLPYLPGQWTCPECLPVRGADGVYTQPPCSGIPDLGWRQRYGYDARAMKPWSRDIQEIGDCYRGGPGNADSLCMPLDGPHGDGFAVQYRFDFWSDVRQAVEAYNADVAAGRPPRGYTRPAGSWLPLIAVSLGTGILATFVWNSRR